MTPATGPGGRPLFTVAALVRLVRGRLETKFSNLWVEGEIADLSRPRSGHLYFSLRDKSGKAALNVVMWSSDARQLRFKPEAGTLVRALGTLTIYDVRGAFQLRATKLEVAGEGDLQRQLEEIRRRLEARGLLSQERKRPLPFIPRRLGVVTSRDGAALRDILKVLRERLPVPVLLSHTSVQGDAAPREIMLALNRIARAKDVDVVIIGRGGGSSEDLKCWHDEELAIAIAGHPVPVITAIGHETDTTIADLVSDRRAATPSEAAMLAVPEPQTLESDLSNLTHRLARAQRARIQQQQLLIDRLSRRLPDRWQLLDGPRQHLDELSETMESILRTRLSVEKNRSHSLEVRLVQAHPRNRLERVRTELAALDGRLMALSRLTVEQKRAQLAEVTASLSALNPLNVLSRGYAFLRRPPDRAPLTSAKNVSVGDRLEVRLDDGSLDCVVEEVGD